MRTKLHTMEKQIYNNMGKVPNPIMTGTPPRADHNKVAHHFLPRTPINPVPGPNGGTNHHPLIVNHPMPSPQPQTPQSPDRVHNLPVELLEAGWRRFWSRREGREYFYNKFTGKNTWDMPVLGSSPPSFHDPLGIQTDNPGSAPGQAGMRRTTSMDEHPLSPTAMTVMNFRGHSWDFTLSTNAVIYERLPSLMVPPHNDIELLRARLTDKLRQHYEELCKSREGVDAPAESFNVWLLERIFKDKGNDPMLPSDCDPAVSSVLFEEIMNEIPIRLVRVRYLVDARQQLVRYAEAAKKMVESRNVPPESRKVVKWQCEDVINWIRRQPYCSLDMYKERLEHLKKQCGAHVVTAAKPSVEGICTKLYNQSKEAVKKINEKQWEILKEHHIAEPPSLKPPAVRKVNCYPVQLVIPSPRLPTVEFSRDPGITRLRYKGEMIEVNASYIQKLDQLYRLNCHDDKSLHNFPQRTWCLLRRYQTFFGLSRIEGEFLQRSLPVPVMRVLQEQFGVTFECFASPLNCYFKQYCSLFLDTDGYFGSRGPFQDFRPISGSFQAFPPPCDAAIEAMVKHVEMLLEKTGEPLSFVIFLPDQRKSSNPVVDKMGKSEFKRKHIVVPGYEHEFRHGMQHFIDERDLFIRSTQATTIFFLQNDTAFEKWPPTDEKLKALTNAFKPDGYEAAVKRKNEEEMERNKRQKKDSDGKEKESAKEDSKGKATEETTNNKDHEYHRSQSERDDSRLPNSDKGHGNRRMSEGEVLKYNQHDDRKYHPGNGHDKH
ncbi:mRNA (2'-O-methyladenosine-N(6)-)-methyltransferase-like [Anneissia japonica]|uniref:mRNA (2'-O-methyladenosine-N(6)-)-methyltransferase-like n=1 Tax=Anneissia japonica TaxID=1529436 RepID=UPI001425A9F8|nr:mRNA (2'-O-methyladenosine-N(6)-)-methyltransferase-like [Anneissia japonica]